MSKQQEPAVRLRPYGPDDLSIQRRFLKDPASTEHLGGPETDAQIARRHERYLAMTEPAGCDVRRGGRTHSATGRLRGLLGADRARRDGRLGDRLVRPCRSSRGGGSRRQPRVW